MKQTPLQRHPIRPYTTSLPLQNRHYPFPSHPLDRIPLRKATRLCRGLGVRLSAAADSSLLIRTCRERESSRFITGAGVRRRESPRFVASSGVRRHLSSARPHLSRARVVRCPCRRRSPVRVDMLLLPSSWVSDYLSQPNIFRYSLLANRSQGYLIALALPLHEPSST